jgi:hypothetical protein
MPRAAIPAHLELPNITILHPISVKHPRPGQDFSNGAIVEQSAQHLGLVQRIAKWLRPGGCFVVSFATSEGDWSGEWLGVPVFFSAHDLELTKQIVARAGLCLERAEFVEQDNEPAKFLWIAARKSL